MDNFEAMRREDQNVLAAFYAEINRIRSGEGLGSVTINATGAIVTVAGGTVES